MLDTDTVSSIHFLHFYLSLFLLLLLSPASEELPEGFLLLSRSCSWLLQHTTAGESKVLR
jgi:hypothetical protein